MCGRSPVIKLARAGEQVLPGGRWRVRTESVDRSELPEGWDSARHPLVAYLDGSRLCGPLVLRPRREGDWFVPLGLKHRQKVSDAMINQLTSLSNFWLYNCAGIWAYVTNDDVEWTSMYSNDENWHLDRGLDTTFECGANRDGYVFSDFVECEDGHTNFGAVDGAGCYLGAWNQSGSLWAR